MTSTDIVRWRGKLIADMTRDELVAALRESAQMYLRLIENSIRNRQYARKRK